MVIALGENKSHEKITQIESICSIPSKNTYTLGDLTAGEQKTPKRIIADKGVIIQTLNARLLLKVYLQDHNVY